MFFVKLIPSNTIIKQAFNLIGKYLKIISYILNIICYLSKRKIKVKKVLLSIQFKAPVVFLPFGYCYQ